MLGSNPFKVDDCVQAERDLLPKVIEE
jgi:hypothetical protein